MLLLTELAARLFNPAGLTPHGFCLLWQPWLIWINVIANAIVGLSYFCIPLVLVVFARRRPDLAFRPIAWLFAAFILLCGTTHALDVLTLWLPAYGLQAMFLAATAAVSLTTAIACWILLPKALRLPSSGQLHEAKAALEDSESRYRAAIFATSAQYDPERERMLDMLGLAATMVHDPDGSIRFWSVGCERLYGWTAEEAIGRSAHELLATVFPTPVAEIDDELRTQGEWNGTVRQFTKAGAEVCVNARAVLRRDDSGRPLVMTSLSDTTELSRAEAALREREEQLHSVVATAADGIILAHVDGRIVSINPAGLRMFGYERETDLIGRNLRVLMPANEATRHDGYLASHRFGAPPRIIGVAGRELLALRRDGTTFPVDLSVGSFGTANARFLTGFVRDATERRSLAEKLAQSQRMEALGQLAGGVAHDFNNILQSISSAARLIDEFPEHVTRTRRMARITIDATERGSSITQRLLSFARGGELRTEPIETTELLDSIREVLAPTLGAEITVRIEAQAQLPPIMADRGQLETVLVNLATNARDAMPDGGTLTLSAENLVVTNESVGSTDGLAPGPYVRISVTDTGHGMNAATLGRSVEPFFTTKPIGKGTGLGLSMAKGFAEQSGGSLAITSAIGGGTTVHLCLRQAPRAMVRDRTGEAGEGAPVGRQGRILLVDDDDAVRETLAIELEDTGFATLVAASGAEALALIEAGEVVDAMVTDLAMPHMNGIVTIQRARALRPALPCFLLTGYAGDRTALASGDDFTLVRKPTSGRVLSARIEAILQTK